MTGFGLLQNRFNPVSFDRSTRGRSPSDGQDSNLRESGAEATCAGSADFGRLIAEDSERWERVIQRGNIKGE